MYLQHLPTQKWSHVELEMVLSQAYMWHTMFNNSPSHLAGWLDLTRHNPTWPDGEIVDTLLHLKFFFSLSCFFLIILESHLLYFGRNFTFALANSPLNQFLKLISCKIIMYVACIGETMLLWLTSNILIHSSLTTNEIDSFPHLFSLGVSFLNEDVNNPDPRNS